MVPPLRCGLDSDSAPARCRRQGARATGRLSAQQRFCGGSKEWSWPHRLRAEENTPMRNDGTETWSLSMASPISPGGDVLAGGRAVQRVSRSHGPGQSRRGTAKQISIQRVDEQGNSVAALKPAWLWLLRNGRKHEISTCSWFGAPCATCSAPRPYLIASK